MIYNYTRFLFSLLLSVVTRSLVDSRVESRNEGTTQLSCSIVSHVLRPCVRFHLRVTSPRLRRSCSLSPDVCNIWRRAKLIPQNTFSLYLFISVAPLRDSSYSWKDNKDTKLFLSSYRGLGTTGTKRERPPGVPLARSYGTLESQNAGMSSSTTLLILFALCQHLSLFTYDSVDRNHMLINDARRVHGNQIQPSLISV